MATGVLAGGRLPAAVAPSGSSSGSADAGGSEAARARGASGNVELGGQSGGDKRQSGGDER
jgi:hypothetical protein